MTADEIQKQRRIWLDHTVRLLKKVSNVRVYALDGPTLLALAALVSEHQKERAAQGGSFDEAELVQFLGSLREHVPSLFQSRPPDESKVPELLKDQFGNIPANPWSEGHINLTEQQLLMRDHPNLAAYLKSVAGGLTYSSLLQQKREREAREKLRAIDYDADTHASNPYRNNADLTRLGEFRRQHGEAVADFYKREATEPVTLPWLADPKTGKLNLTNHMTLRRRAPELAELADRSVETARDWSQEIVSTNSAKIAELDARRAEAQRILQSQSDTVKMTT